MKEEALNVLLVEDNAGDARLLRELLTAQYSDGVSLTHVVSLAAAVECLSRRTLDVALVDLGLPDARGVETVRQVHATAPDLAIIVLTGLDDREVAMRALREGAQDYLAKGRLDGPLVERAIRYAIERQKMMTALHSLALIDDLTGLYNRRGFMALAEHHVMLAHRSGRGFALVFVDVDRLKAINDTLGHLEGDQTLQDLAVILKESFRSSDILGRIGGDEFCALMIDAGADITDVVRRRLLERTEARNAQSGRRPRLSFSLGVLCCRAGESRSLETLLSEVDALMYSDKRTRSAARPIGESR